jgi:succinate-semialdehyde dehydrogenase/glutarate-semialdehyde dehydrogenase
MSIRSVNPKTGKVMKEYERISDEELQHQLDKAYDCYKRWRNSGEEGLKERLEKFGKLKQLLNERREQLCLTITEEMGKPIKQTYNEVDKSIALIDYYVENVKDFLADEEVKTKFPSCWV